MLVTVVSSSDWRHWLSMALLSMALLTLAIQVGCAATGPTAAAGVSAAVSAGVSVGTSAGVVIPTVTSTKLKSIAIMDFELIDDTRDSAREAAQNIRLAAINQQLRTAFAHNHLYNVVDNASATPLIADLSSRLALHDCNGCDVDIGRALNTDRVLTAWVQKVSNLILNINIQIRDVQTGLVVLNKSVDIRGNTDQSWSRGIEYMVRSMVEKNQGNR